MQNLFMFLYPLVAAIGGANIKKTLDGTSWANGINGFLQNGATAVGGILIAVAVLKIVMSLAEENAAERQRASMLLGVGIVFISIRPVVSGLIGTGITEESDYKVVAANVLDLLGSMATWAAAVLLIMAVYSFITAIAQEDSAQQVKGTNAVLVSIGFLTFNAICTTIGKYIKVANHSTNLYMMAIIGWLVKVASYAGGALLILAVFRLVVSVREEDAKARNDGIKLLVVSIALISFRLILKGMGFDMLG